MRVTIPDELAAKLEAHVNGSRSLDDVVTAHIQRLVEHAVPPVGRCAIVNEEMLNLLERRLGSPALGTAGDIYRAVDKLAGVEINRINLEFTPAQLTEIKERAAREGATPQDYAVRIVHSMVPMFFQTGPAQTGPMVKKK